MQNAWPETCSFAVSVASSHSGSGDNERTKALPELEMMRSFGKSTSRSSLQSVSDFLK